MPSSFWNAFTLQPGSTTITLIGRQFDLGGALEDGVDDAVGLIEGDGAHGFAPLCRGPRSARLRCDVRVAKPPYTGHDRCRTIHPPTSSPPPTIRSSKTGPAPFGVPPFGRIKPEHFAPAFDRAFAEHDAEIAAIAADRGRADLRQHHRGAGARRPAARRASIDVFGVLTGAHTNDALLAIEREIAPAPRPALERHPAQRAAVRAASTRSTARATGSASPPSRRACWSAIT